MIEGADRIESGDDGFTSFFTPEKFIGTPAGAMAAAWSPKTDWGTGDLHKGSRRKITSAIRSRFDLC
jgi:hypothetical protein